MGSDGVKVKNVNKNSILVDLVLRNRKQERVLETSKHKTLAQTGLILTIYITLIKQTQNRGIALSVRFTFMVD